MKLLKFTFITLLITVSHVNYACTCIGKSTVKKALKNSDAVFVGTVLEVKLVTDTVENQFVIKEYVYTFHVEKIYKNSTRKNMYLEVRSGYGGGDCGIRFSLGEKYIIYSYKSSKQSMLRTDICTRTTHYNKEEIEALDKLTN